MGCDIHTVTEVLTESGWVESYTDNPIFDWRSYGMYGFLADVRNLSAIPCLWAHRGFPEDCSREAKNLLSSWDTDGHSATFVTLEDLTEFDYDMPVEDRRFSRTIGNFTDGGCTAKPGHGRMTTYREFLGEAFFSDIDRLRLLGKPENVRVLMLFDN